MFQTAYENWIFLKTPRTIYALQMYLTHPLETFNLNSAKVKEEPWFIYALNYFMMWQNPKYNPEVRMIWWEK